MNRQPLNAFSLIRDERPRQTRTVLTINASFSGIFVGRLVIEYGRPTIYLEDLWVEPAFRNRGVGDQLLRLALQEARIQGGAMVQCDPIAYALTSAGTRRTLPAADQEQLRHWYAARGFSPASEDEGSPWELQL